MNPKHPPCLPMTLGNMREDRAGKTHGRASYWQPGVRFWRIKEKPPTEQIGPRSGAYAVRTSPYHIAFWG